jgi:2-polyprenyl-3-methyl-5-hydroxy-6-metoxy-1,4-benzoquinol methylase
MPPYSMNKKIEKVKDFFTQAEQYLHVKGSFNIQIRAEAVADFVGDECITSILDIGCGDGTISLPLLRQDNQLTLLDISSTMLSIASSHVPPHLLSNVKMVNEDFILAELHPQTYDLILCLGVLAHVDSPMNVIAKMVSLLKPSGSIIVQNSNSQHLVRYLSYFYSVLRNSLLRTSLPPNQYLYALNQLSDTKLMKTFRSHGLKLRRSYRYNVHIPGTGRLFPSDFKYNKQMYKIVRKIYGNTMNNRLSWLGAECIYGFKKL